MKSNAIAANKKAYRDYAIFDKWECGIVLKGGEVKSVRAGEVNFKDSFARVEEEEIWLYSLHISPYTQASYMNDEPDRPRKLLLAKKEIKKLIGKTAEKGLTLVPLRIYFNRRGYAKVELALAKGKKHYDKRESLKRKAQEKDIKRALKFRP